MPLFSLPNYIGCPHTAALTKEAIEAVAMKCAHAIDDLPERAGTQIYHQPSEKS